MAIAKSPVNMHIFPPLFHLSFSLCLSLSLSLSLVFSYLRWPALETALSIIIRAVQKIKIHAGGFSPTGWKNRRSRRRLTDEHFSRNNHPRRAILRKTDFSVRRSFVSSHSHGFFLSNFTAFWSKLEKRNVNGPIL